MVPINWILQSYNPVTPSSQSQNLLEKHICSSADRRKKDERTPDASGASVVERPDLTVIVIHDYLFQGNSTSKPIIIWRDFDLSHDEQKQRLTLPWPLPRPFLSSLDGSSPRFGRRGWSRRGADWTGGRRSGAPREQRAEGARGRAARGHRLPALVLRAPRARLPLPGSEEAGPDGEEGAGLWWLLWRRGWQGRPCSEICGVLEAVEAGGG